MLLMFLAYLSGALTIVSPCILPVLPFVLARAGQPFLRNGLPMLLAMGTTFATVALLATVGGNWAVEANQFGRWAALAVMAMLGLTLVFPALAEWLSRPAVRLGARLGSAAGKAEEARFGSSLLLGVATGLLWAPCAGPILGLILTGAAFQGASANTALLLISYAAGAASALSLALFVGGRVFLAMKKSLGMGEAVRKGLGLLVLVAVTAIALGIDTGLLTRLSVPATNRVEQGLIDRVGLLPMSAPNMKTENALAPLTSANSWFNSPPLTAADLKGKVVLVNFWTYSCINCVRSMPYVRAWAEKYRPYGLVVIGVHTPEFAFERDPENVDAAIRRFAIRYPVAMDNEFRIWRAFGNHYWPALYFVDAKNTVQATHFGEGEYQKSEWIIQQLLRDSGRTDAPDDLISVVGEGAEAPPPERSAGPVSPETYLGFEKRSNLRSPQDVQRDQAQIYSHAPLVADSWSLAGNWTVHSEYSEAQVAGAKLAYRFRGRDLHLVMGSDKSGVKIRFRVTIDGRAPVSDAGSDINAEGYGEIDGQRLYQLVRQAGAARERRFEIEFLTEGAQVFAFTFG